MDFNELKDKMLAALGQATDSAKDIAGKAAVGAKDFAGKAADSAKDIAGKAADKAKVGGRIAKLSMEAATEKENMKKAYLEIGKLYYDTHKDAPEGFFIQLCEEVSIAQQRIAENEAEIAALKESFNGCAGEPDVEVEFEEIVEQTEAEAAPEVVPETAPEIVPEVAPEDVPEVVPEAAPEIVPEAAPEVVPEAAPEAAPEAEEEKTEE